MARSQAISLALHVALLLAVSLIGARSIARLQNLEAPRPATRLVLPHRQVRESGAAHAGGSGHDKLPAQRGQPPPPARRTFVWQQPAPNPALPLAQTIAFTMPAPEIDTDETGDPFSRYSSGALGIGNGHDIGDRGIGDGIGPGQSGSPGYSAAQLKRMTPPRLIYRVEPEFSEEARKAKYQGTVVLRIDVDTSGRARNIRVLRQLGLGLDEKAVEAVSEWRFRPALLDGKAVVMSAVVEVNFHLL